MRIFLLLFHIQELTKFDVLSIFKPNAPLAKLLRPEDHTVVVGVSAVQMAGVYIFVRKDQSYNKTDISLRCTEQVLEICAI
jgi:hypothetical protein